MDKRTLSLLLAVLILIIAGVGVWLILMRPAPAVAPEPTPEVPVMGEPVTVEDMGQYHEITASYPSSVPTPGNNAAILKTFVDTEIATFKSESGLMTLTPEDIEMFGLGTDRKYALDIEYTTYTSPRTVSYVFTIYADTLGAHPNAYYRTFTFNTQSGAELDVEDLFTAAPYITLSEIARTQLTQSLGESEYLTTGTEPNTANYQWFYVANNELVLIFPPYQVGPWAIGTQMVRIPKTEIAGQLKAEYR